MPKTIKEWLYEIDKVDSEHSPSRRAGLSDALVDELRGIFGTDERFQEICEAERDGLCVVLPCRVGSDIYWIDDDNEVKCQKNGVRGIVIRKDKILIEDTDGCIDEIGTKYCYLSKEAAESALKGGAK